MKQPKIELDLTPITEEKLEELGLEVKVLLNEDSGYEDDFYLNVNNKIDVMEGAYQKWDTYIEEEDKEVSFMNDEELIKYIKLRFDILRANVETKQVI
jgi:hypothetical protein